MENLKYPWIYGYFYSVVFYLYHCFVSEVTLLISKCSVTGFSVSVNLFFSVFYSTPSVHNTSFFCSKMPESKMQILPNFMISEASCGFAAVYL